MSVNLIDLVLRTFASNLRMAGLPAQARRVEMQGIEGFRLAREFLDSFLQICDYNSCDEALAGAARDIEAIIQHEQSHA